MATKLLNIKLMKDEYFNLVSGAKTITALLYLNESVVVFATLH